MHGSTGQWVLPSNCGKGGNIVKNAGRAFWTKSTKLGYFKKHQSGKTNGEIVSFCANAPASPFAVHRLPILLCRFLPCIAH
jgi:hypothetical protein